MEERVQRTGNVCWCEKPKSPLEAQEPEGPAVASQPVTHGGTSLLNPAWTPACWSLRLRVSSCLHSAQTPEQSRSLESMAKTEVLCIHLGVICGKQLF